MVRFGRYLILLFLLAVWTGTALLTDPPDLPAWERLGAGGDSADRGAAGATDDSRQPADSLLHRVIWLTALGYQLPTDSGVQIKALMLRGGATAMAVTALVFWGLSIRRRAGRREDPLPRVRPRPPLPALRQPSIPAPPALRFRFGRPIPWQHPGPLGWALLLAAGWAAWSAAAVYWAHSPPEATKYFQAFAFPLVLAIVVAVTLDRGQVLVAAVAWLVLSVVLAELALWQGWAGSTPGPLASFVGDSKELAGLLLAAVVLAIVLAVGRLLGRPGGAVVGNQNPASRIQYPASNSPFPLVPVVLLLAAALCLLAIWRCSTGAREASLLAFPVGVGLALVLLARGWRRAVWAAATVLVLLSIGGLIRSGRPAGPPPDSPAGLAAVLADHGEPLIDADRWSLAWQVFRDRPVTGHGGWGFRLLADGLAERRGASDPRWSARPVGSAGSFWLEQLTDLGIVGALLLGAAFVVLLGAAGGAIRRCPWPGHRWVIAGLAGGLAAMFVYQAFAASLDRNAFAAALAGWAGLTAAAVRWASRPLPPRGRDEYRLGFYSGGLMFLAGAAVVLSATAYLVVEDWQAGRNLFQAVHEDLPRAGRAHRQVLADLRSGPASSARNLPRHVLARDEATSRAAARLFQATRWTIDSSVHLGEMWAEADLVTLQADWQIAQEAASAAGRPAAPVPIVRSAAWADRLKDAGRLLAMLEDTGDEARPAHRQSPAVSRAVISLLTARGRLLSYGPGLDEDRRHILLAEVTDAVVQAALLLDRRLAENPADLDAALLRERMGDRAGLAEVSGLPSGGVAWLLACRPTLRVAPAERLRLLRDGLRDYGIPTRPIQARAAAGTEPMGREGAASEIVWSGLPPAFYDALARAVRDRDQSGPCWEAMLAAAARVEAGQARDWPADADTDVRNAPQTFRLAAELELLNHAAARRLRLPSLPALSESEEKGSRPISKPEFRPGRPEGRKVLSRGRKLPDFDLARKELSPEGATETPAAAGSLAALRRAEAWLARADVVYRRDATRFAEQRLIVALERAQVAWALRDLAAASGANANFRDPERVGTGPKSAWGSDLVAALANVNPARRRAAGQALAATRAFLLADAGEWTEAESWYAQAGDLALGSLETFLEATDLSWRERLLPVPAAPARPAPVSRSPAAAPPASATQPEPPKENPLWPARLP